MATLLRVPEVAAGAIQAILSEWLVPENTEFSAGQPLVVLETDKAAVEVEAEADGVLLRTLVSSGSTVEVGSPMALLGEEHERGDVSGLLASLGVGNAARAPAPAAVPPAPGAAPVERLFVSPLARKMLKEAGLSADGVRGTGPDGRIVRRDVEKAIASSRTTEPPAVAPPPPVAVAPPPTTTVFTDIPHTRLRRAVAARLTASKQTIPHFYLRRTVRIDALLDLRARLNAVATGKISVNDLIIRAVGVAYQAVPTANVIWTDDALRQFTSVDVAVAIASARGLVTPVIRGVEKTSPSAISGQVKEFVRQADSGKLHQRDLEGGTVTVSNLGMYGVDEFSAIINPPHSAILAVGAGKPGPVVVDGELRVGASMNLVLSVDHRAVDGALAAEWLGALVTALEEPLRLVV
jgi:pyruvate dehydrogenase E2 component (dihydrolipoamide acetyltransferase)